MNTQPWIFFFHENEVNGCFSNWYPSPFTLDGITYRHVEQYIMAMKAKMFGDTASFDAILKADSPAVCKSLGRGVSGYVDPVWASRRHRVLLTGLREKFAQNPELREALLATGEAGIAEANPNDPVFAIGMSAADAAATDPDNWPGQNLLGLSLMELREDLREEDE